MLRTTSEAISPAITKSVAFIADRVQTAAKSRVIVAVSGGIDSAVSLTLAAKAVGIENVTALLLPYGEQAMQDAKVIAEFIGLPSAQVIEVPITPIVQVVAETLQLPTMGELTEVDRLRLGNVMARSRMLLVFDYAKKLDALVCGTENKSEHYLGYFTRFGDEASDLEPLADWWKTEVRAAAQALHLPEVFLTKAPSAGLWQGQTDETELGFSYEQADQVLAAWAQPNAPTVTEIASASGVAEVVVEAVLSRVTASKFKREVPYRFTESV
jgi:NAD+ synthase